MGRKELLQEGVYWIFVTLRQGEVKDSCEHSDGFPKMWAIPEEL